MAIEQGVCASFCLELVQAIHDFTADTFKVALYESTADLTPDTTAYTTTGEVSGSGYTAGGATLTFEESTPKLLGRRLVISFADVTWSSASFTTRAALIYNASKANRAWCVIDFGGNIARSGEDFVLPSPTVDGDNALFRMIGSGGS